MFKNYFYLNRAVIEQRVNLIGRTIYEIYSQEKDTLYINISSEENPDLHLVLSINQNEPYIILKNHHKAKKNTVDFFTGNLPLEIIDLQISDSDRILKIVCDRAEIYAAIRGTLSNVLFHSLKGDNEFFKKVKKVEEDNYINELVGHNYTSEFNFPVLDIPGADDLTGLRKALPYLTKDIANEVKARLDTENYDEQKKIVREMLNEIKDENIILFYSPELGRYVFQPRTFISLKPDDEKFEFDSYQEAIAKLFVLNSKFSRLYQMQKEISRYLDKELSGIASKLNDIRKRVETGSKDEVYRHNADQLIANLYQLKKGMKEIELDDFTPGEKIKIKLMEDLSPQENVSYYYEKARGEKINYEKSCELFEHTEKRYNFLLGVKNEFDKAEDIQTLEQIKSRLGIKEKIQTTKMDDKLKFRHFIIDDKYDVYVGKDSKSNDILSVKFAKQNDFWFHARGYAGSHVVLRVDNPKEGVPKNILKNAASIAAFYSKAKTAGTAPVVCTFAKYVTKRKGMEPGQVSVQREDVLLVRPEIPSNAKYIEE